MEDIEVKVRQDCYNRGYQEGRKDSLKETFEELVKMADAEYLLGIPNPSKGKLSTAMIKIVAQRFGVDL